MLLLSAILLGLALATTSGLRVFLPLLGVSLAARFHLITLQPDFGWLTGSILMVCLIFATVAEIIAGYIVPLNNALVFITLPLSMAAGAILSTSVLPAQDPVLRWAAGLVAGGISAGIMHASTGLLYFLPLKRFRSADFHLTATGKNILALGGTLLSILLPQIAGIAAIITTLWLGNKMIKQFYVPPSE